MLGLAAPAGQRPRDSPDGHTGTIRIRLDPSSPKLSGIRETGLVQGEIHTALIWQKVRSEFGPAHIQLYFGDRYDQNSVRDTLSKTFRNLRNGACSRRNSYSVNLAKSAIRIWPGTSNWPKSTEHTALFWRQVRSE